MRRSFIIIVVILFAFACSVEYIHDGLLEDKGSNRLSEITMTANNMNVLVPAYFDPVDNSEFWHRLSAQAKKMPGRICIIANPSNGPGLEMNQSYVDAINNFRANGGLVLGYVPTGYGNRAISDVESFIDCWYQWYKVDGIFLDEQAGLYQPGFEEYYSKIYTYIKKRNKNLVVGNPGGETRTTYIPLTDVIFRYENTGSEFSSAENGYWVNHYTRSNFGALLYGTDIWKEYIDIAAALNYGWIYITDDILKNPWDSLPDYFEEMCDYLKTYTPVEIVNIIERGPEQGSYRIRNRYNGKYLDVSANGNNVVARECSESEAAVWELVPGQDNHYIMTVNERIAELDDELLYSGLNIKASHASGNLTQRWQFEETGNGFYKIKSKFSGMIMHQLGSGNIVQADYGGWTNQEWEIIKVNYLKE